MEGEGSSSGLGKRPRLDGEGKRPRGRPPGRAKKDKAFTSIIPAERTYMPLKHMEKHINVWLDQYHNIVEAVYPGHKCPYGANDMRMLNFILRRVTLETGQSFVECLKQHGELLGVRACKQSTEQIMEPDRTQWFIYYLRTKFRVRIDPTTKAPLRISLATKNELSTPEGQPAPGVVRFPGVDFIVYRGGPNQHITGAVLYPQIDLELRL